MSRPYPPLRLATIVGARPQFVKAAAFSRVWRRRHREILIHTGQHYDPDMSDIFFRELSIPRPAYHLGIRGKGQSSPTGRMLDALERLLARLKPDGVLVYGDTYSTLAGALAGASLHLPVFHVEAGLRSYERSMPEETNRVVTDHVSDLLFAPSKAAARHLAHEGLRTNVHVVGDVMQDAFRYYKTLCLKRTPLKRVPSRYAFATVHRAQTTDEVGILPEICDALDRLPLPVIWPIHPRTHLALKRGKIRLGKNITAIDPVGYLQSIQLQSQAEVILTDSGGIQKEAYFLRKPCVTLRRETEWTETLATGHNVLGGLTSRSIAKAFRDVQANHRRPWPTLFGSGNACDKIVRVIESFFGYKH